MNKPRTRILLAFALFASVIVAGCGGSSSPVSVMPAAKMVEALKTQGLPIAGSVAYTAADDPNKLLGRPNQYISKGNFQDSRLKTAEDFDTSGGGSVEVFASPDDAQRRATYLDGIGKAIPFLLEYEYVQGSVLLRLSSDLTPDQARQYQDALKAVVK
ncbi:MAG TPA: hypothetical protein VIP09_02205 [Dehalococcoidia bacterium]